MTDTLHNLLFETLEELEDELIALLGDLRGKLIDWLAEAARGDLTLGELEALLEGEKALLEMTVLKQKVETKVLVNTLKQNLLEGLVGIVRRAL